MTAAALVQLLNGSPAQGVDAASMAIQNTLGMICDPVANRVEVPCLGKNIMAGMNALASANMALAGYDKVIPLDETLDALWQVGSMLPQELRCTCMGGLSLTDTSARIGKRLDEANEQRR
jgi:L-serine dehydratase